jgi:hypothetical protein
VVRRPGTVINDPNVAGSRGSTILCAMKLDAPTASGYLG